MKRSAPLCASAVLAAIALCSGGGAVAAGLPDSGAYDVVIRNGSVYDGSGSPPFNADVAIRADRIVRIGPALPGRGIREIDARGKAVAPGFINMLAHPEESLLVDGRGLSDLAQGVTLEVLGEDSMGPLTAEMKAHMVDREGDLKYPVDWTSLDEYLRGLERRGVSPNVASFVSAGTVRTYVLGEGDVQPTPEQLDRMRGLVRRAMEDGALGLTDALMYAPATYARTPELISLADVSAACGGIYIAHIRNEGDRLLEAIDETIEIARATGAPAEIYHFKQAGKDNWPKLAPAIAKISEARAAGLRITADMYTYPASATGLDAAMPSWVQDGGLEAWIRRLKDPSVRARVTAEMRNPHPADWDNAYGAAGGGEGVLLLQFKNPKLKPLTGKRLSEVARARGESPEDAAVDLVIEDGSRVGVAYFEMSEDNLRTEVALPWMSFGSDEAAPAPEGVFLKSLNHPRAYGNFARLLARYVREEKALGLPAAIRQLTSLPADNLSLTDRGRLRPGAFADVVVFDPLTISDHATFDQPAQLATGVEDVLVNGRIAFEHGAPTGAPTGRVVRGRAFTGAPGGGCRTSAADWTWRF